MFERFTDRARRVVVLAQEEARMLYHNYIGTEHLLLGLLHEGDGVAAKALEGLGLSLEKLREEVEKIIGTGAQAPSGHIPFTPRAKKVIELSMREALQLGHNYIGTEHLLLGLIREGEGVGAQVLVRSGADLNRVRQKTIELLSGYPAKDLAKGSAYAQNPTTTPDPHEASDNETFYKDLRITTEAYDALAAALKLEQESSGLLMSPSLFLLKTFNKPKPAAGILPESSVFNSMTVQQMFDALLYPYINKQE